LTYRYFRNKKAAMIGILLWSLAGKTRSDRVEPPLTTSSLFLGMHVLALKPKLAKIRAKFMSDNLAHQQVVQLSLLHSQGQTLLAFEF